MLIIKMFDDPTPSGIINNRILSAFLGRTGSTTLDESERSDLGDLLILVAHKLALVFAHYSRFENEQSRLTGEATNNPVVEGQEVVRLEPSQILFFEFDGFLVQVKSVLDHLAKVPAIPLGRKKWTIRSFGGKGADVIRSMRNNIPSEKREFAKAIIKSIEGSKGWLEMTIDARDRINHFIDGGINFKNFVVFARKNSSGELLMRVPMWNSEQQVLEFMNVVWENLFQFVEEFIGCCFAMKIKPGLAMFHGPSQVTRVDSPWVITTVEVMERETSRPGWEKL